MLADESVIQNEVAEEVTIEEENVSEETILEESGAAATLVQTIWTQDNYEYRITVSYDKTAGIPADASLIVKEMTSDNTDVLDYIDQSAETLMITREEISSVRLFDICLVGMDGTEYQPSEKVAVRIELISDSRGTEPLENEIEDLKVVHFGEETEELQAEVEDNTVLFNTDGFSVFSLVDTTTVENEVEAQLTTNGTLYENDDIILTGSMPLDGIVEAEQVSVSVDGNDALVAYDIKIYANESFKELGITWQPTESTIRVKVKSDALANAKGTLLVYHLETPESEAEFVAEVEADQSSVAFEAAGFSAYAIVPGPEEVLLGWTKVQDMTEFKALVAAGTGLYIGHPEGFYFKNETYKVNNTSRTGIVKTKPAQNYPMTPGAVPYYFEAVAGTDDQFYAYCYGSNNTKLYVNHSSNSLSLVSEAKRTAFTFSSDTDEVFTVYHGGYYWNMQGNAAGNGFAAYTENNAGSKLNFWFAEDIDDDLYHLDGKKYGLMNYNDGLAGKALMAEELNSTSLVSLALTVMTRKDDYQDKLFVPDNSEITIWTFTSAGQDYYYLSADVEGTTQYLKIESGGISLSSDPVTVKVTAGSGSYAGQIFLSNGSTTLIYSGNIAQGFTTGSSAGSEWLYFVDLSELTDDYFMTYSARKVSVSDEEVTNGSRIIIYTRSWDDAQKKYVFYAIDHDGSLVPCFESGDSVQWIGTRLNSLLWNFVEYYEEDTTDPTGFYELYNQYSGKYIAPQVTDGQILSDDTLGINLNGRENGYYYSKIFAWDNGHYDYAGLKVEDDHIVSCPMNEAEDFYFAVMQDIEVDDKLTTVPTVDHEQYGITMKVKNFNSRLEMSDFLGNNKGGAGEPPTQGILSESYDLSVGYPTTTAKGSGGSLGTLFEGARQVNHLFIASTYGGSGYYEFDSTQNFASLQKDNTFKVYKEIGSYDSSGSRNTLKHGQFFPFNDLEAGVFASVNKKNLYDALAQSLPNSDPRKNENLYLIKNVDCYFGVEIEATFTMTLNGLDSWGHDIIYEFTGDDDFWLYVDGELVIDLGGIHSALPGSVNYSTGEVNVNGKRTTLYEIFKKHYKKNHPNATDAQVNAYLSGDNGVFEQNAQGQWIFKAYTTHNMKIFYMERGAGASNLHMRFNLASVKPGSVLLSKELSGVDSSESILAEFPYQIWYKTSEEGEPIPLTQSASSPRVVYKDTTTAVTYKNSVTVDGIAYNNVFLLKPDEIAEISFPEDAVLYSITECGVNTDIYQSVTVNGTQIDGTAVAGLNNRRDYPISFASTKERARVVYVNNVNPAALRTLSITKILYQEDGVTPIYNDPSTFAFRLYLGTEFDASLKGANMHTYHVKDSEGHYCSWDAASQRLVSTGITDYSSASAEEKAAISFHTSMYGAISKIPAFYTVEVREVLAGTQFMVEERANEIPDGYSLQKYTLDGMESQNPAIGLMTSDHNVTVCNIRGWGLRVNKSWTDADYMSERAATYFAIYTGTDEASLTLVDGSIREMPQKSNTIYWYYKTLPVNVPFYNYEIREVTVKNAVVEDGVVTSYSSVTPVAHGNPIEIAGKQKGETTSSKFTYTVLYEKGIVEEGSNVRVDKVTNNRPGIVIRKQDWSGHALSGATFTITDRDGNEIGTFTSDKEGLVTVAFLRDDVDYTLTETKAPARFQGLPNPMKIRLSNGTVKVSGVDDEYYVIQQNDGATPEVIVKNRPFKLEVIKVGETDTGSERPLSGVHFELHREVTVDGVTQMDRPVLTGFDDVITDENGTLPSVDEKLKAISYYIKEKAALSGYKDLPGTVRFTISETGFVTLTNTAYAELNSETLQDGTIQYTLKIKNELLHPAPSGITSNLWPYLLLLLFGAAIVVIVFFLRKRRKDKDDDLND